MPSLPHLPSTQPYSLCPHVPCSARIGSELRSSAPNPRSLFPLRNNRKLRTHHSSSPMPMHCVSILYNRCSLIPDTGHSLKHVRPHTGRVLYRTHRSLAGPGIRTEASGLSETRCPEVDTAGATRSHSEPKDSRPASMVAVEALGF